MTTIVAIRPQPGCSATVELGRELGLGTLSYPMSEIQPRAWEVPEATDVDALLVGSANAIRHGGVGLDELLAKPVHAVGPATAQLSQLRGLEVASVGSGGLQALLSSLPSKRVRLLRLAGAEHVALSVPDHIEVTTRIVYENFALPMPEALATLLKDEALVLLHSAAAARHFAGECGRLGLDRARISLAALGPRICEAAGSGWARAESAPQPREPALLALAADMCH